MKIIIISKHNVRYQKSMINKVLMVSTDIIPGSAIYHYEHNIRSCLLCIIKGYSFKICWWPSNSEICEISPSKVPHIAIETTLYKKLP